MDIKEQIALLTKELEDLQKRWPAHSVKPHMVEELERLEDELENLIKIQGQKHESQSHEAQIGH